MKKSKWNLRRIWQDFYLVIIMIFLKTFCPSTVLNPTQWGNFTSAGRDFHKPEYLDAGTDLLICTDRRHHRS